MPSKFEAMRLSNKHWKLGVIYYCRQDPRVVVRNRFSIGWAWNFGHRFVLVAILLAGILFCLPALVAYYLGVRSIVAIASLLVLSLCSIMLIVNTLAKDPES